MKTPALGGDLLVDLRRRVERERHPVPPQTAAEVAEEVDLEEVVEEDEEEGGEGQEVVG